MVTADDYFNEFLALLPAGPAWSVQDSANATALIEGLVQEFERVQLAADGLLNEADPRSTYQLLGDYERIFGLPTACMAGITQSLDQRRAALVAQMISQGGQSPAYYVALAAAAGFTITITEFRPFTVASTVATPIYGDGWAYAFQINAPLNTIAVFDVTSSVADALRTWGNNLLECLINRYKPAHTVALFSYS